MSQNNNMMNFDRNQHITMTMMLRVVSEVVVDGRFPYMYDFGMKAIPHR